MSLYRENGNVMTPEKEGQYFNDVLQLESVVAIQERFEDHGVEVSPENENQLKQEMSQVHSDPEAEHTYDSQERVGDIAPLDQSVTDINPYSNEAVQQIDEYEIHSKLAGLVLEIKFERDDKVKDELERDLLVL